MNKTLEYLLKKIGTAPIAGLRQQMVQRLIRMKALDAARLQGRFVVLIDGSGYLVFRSRHCDHCLTQRHGETTLYMHQVLEAKLLGPAGTVVSIATEFIDNSDVPIAPAGASQEQLKQDCELKALRRLMAGLRVEFPQLPSVSMATAYMPAGKVSRSRKTFDVITSMCLSLVGYRPSGRIPELAAAVPRPAGGADDAAGGSAGLSLGQRPELQGQRRPRVDPQRH